MLLPLASPGLARRAWSFQRVDLLVYRGLFGGVAVLLYFLAIERIPVGLATLLNSTSPVWAVLSRRSSWASARGRWRRCRSRRRSSAWHWRRALSRRRGPASASAPGRAVALASSILSGAAVAAGRAARRSEGSWAIYGSFTLCGVVVTAPFALADWRWPDAREWTLLVAVGLASVAAQLLMTHAYRWVTNFQAGVCCSSPWWGPTDSPAVFEEEISVAASFTCGLETQDSVVDLLFVGQEAYCVMAGRGFGQVEQLLEVLACVQPSPPESFAQLHAHVMKRAGMVNGAICVLVAWNELRQRFIQGLLSLGLPILVLIMR